MYVGPMTVILWPTRHKRGDMIAFQLIDQFTEIRAKGWFGIAGFTDKDHGIGIVIKDPFLQHVQHLVEFKASVGGGESGDDHIGFGVGFDKILGVLESDFNDVVTHQVGVEHGDFVRGK